MISAARVRLACSFVLLFLPSAAFAQAWTRDQGKGYVNVSLTTLSAEKVYGPDFSRYEINRYSQLTLGLYGEIGIVDRWLTATVNADLLRRNRISEQGETTGLGDMRVGLWSGLIAAPFRLTVGVVAGLPTGDPEPQADAGTDEDAELIAASLPTGDGELDVEPRIIAGTSFGGAGSGWLLAHYLTAEIGYQVRTKGFSDALTYAVAFGSRIPFDVLDRFLLTLRFYGTESFASQAEASNGFAGLGNGLTHTSVSGELYGRIWEGLGASISADTAVRARGIVAAPPLRLSLSYEF